MAMAEEEPSKQAAPENVAFVDETSPPENDADGSGGGAVFANGSKGNGKGRTFNGRGKGRGRDRGRGKKQREEKEQVPIEELYDLTKPIKRIERPSKEKHDAEVSGLDATIDILRAERKSLQSKIDATLSSNKTGNSPLAKERDALNRLKNRKGLMIEQKRQLRTRLEVVRANADRLAGQARSARSGMRFSSVSDIEREIHRLERKHETTSMSLAQEKELIRELDALKASKRTAKQLHEKQGDLDGIRQNRNALQAELKVKDREIDTIQKKIDVQSATVKELVEKNNIQRGAADELLKRQDQLKVQLDGKFKERSHLKTLFRDMTNEWFQNQRAIKAQRQLQFDEEKKRRETEKQAWLKKKEEEELAKTPYEEEMALCVYLSDFLTKTYLTDAKLEAEKKTKATDLKPKADVYALKDNPFSGLKAVSKKGDDEFYLGSGRAKVGKKKGKSKKTKQSSSFSLSLDLFDQFYLISLSPPTTLEAVPASVDELKAKKKWYSEQPRGSVPTARDIRKGNQTAAAKERGGTSGGKTKNGSNGKNKHSFDISDDNEFAPLGAGPSSSGAKSTWGQKADNGVAQPSS